MITYFDTSALVKLFVAEVHCISARRWAASAALVMVSQVAWPEFCSAMALKRRTGQLAPSEVQAILGSLSAQWPKYHRLAVDSELFNEAGALVLQHDLRAYDGVQLASALRAANTVGSSLRMCCFDKSLSAAAKQRGLVVLEPQVEGA